MTVMSCANIEKIPTVYKNETVTEGFMHTKILLWAKSRNLIMVHCGFSFLSSEIWEH